MISFLQGRVVDVFENSLVLNVHGVGFLIQTAHPEFFQKEKEINLIIHMQWHQEQGPALYGFLHEQEKTIFLMVTDCSGFGPKIALLLLKKFTPFDFVRAIQIADLKAFSCISGIGPKKAEQLVVQLKHKVNALLDKGWVEGSEKNNVLLGHWKDLYQALLSLHYSRQEVDKAIATISQESFEPQVSFDFLLRKALVYLAKK